MRKRDFRILVMKRPGKLPYVNRPWVAICQDWFPPIMPGDQGFLPTLYAHTKAQVLKDMSFTIHERLVALGVKEWKFH